MQKVVHPVKGQGTVVQFAGQWVYVRWDSDPSFNDKVPRDSVEVVS